MTGDAQQVQAADATPEPGGSERPVVFLHIPKTAGTSFIGTLRNAFGQDRLIRLAAIDGTTADEIGRLLSKRPDNPACLIGHVPFHAIAPWRERCSIFTILRHPIDRVMSLYRFLLGRPAEELLRLELRPGFSFEEFIASRHPELFAQVHDGMVRQLCGDAQLMNPDLPGFWSEAACARTVGAALHTLDGIDFGLAEDMGNTLRVARDAMRIPYELSTGRDNVTSSRRHLPDVDCCLAIVACNAMDLVLYERAAALFAGRCARPGIGAAAAAWSRSVHAATPGQETAIRGIRGLQGFHEVETEGFAWLDSEQANRLHFDLQAASALIRLNCFAIGKNYPIGDIAIEVNGVEVPARAYWTEEPWLVIELDPVALRHPVNVLSIRPPYFVPVRFLDPTASDPRSLSIAVAKVTFAP